MTEQTKQKLKDILIEHKNIASSEYYDEDAFVGIYFNDLVDIINSIMHNTGWHPASELPKLGEDDNNEFIVIASVDNELYRHGPMIDKPKKAMFIDGQWTEPNVKWWCYPPKEE